MKQIHVDYFASFRDFTGKSEESIAADVTNALELYGQLSEQYAFSLPADSVRVAVNDEFSDWQTTLEDGDRVVFIPPVAGG